MSKKALLVVDFGHNINYIDTKTVISLNNASKALSAALARRETYACVKEELLPAARLQPDLDIFFVSGGQAAGVDFADLADEKDKVIRGHGFNGNLSDIYDREGHLITTLLHDYERIYLVGETLDWSVKRAFKGIKEAGLSDRVMILTGYNRLGEMSLEEIEMRVGGLVQMGATDGQFERDLPPISQVAPKVEKTSEVLDARVICPFPQI